MRYLFTWIACCLALTVFSAAPLEKNRWHDFEGLVADKATHLSVYVEDNGKIVGSFCYAGKKPEHTVQGLMEGELIR